MTGAGPLCRRPICPPSPPIRRRSIALPPSEMRDWCRAEDVPLIGFDARLADLS